MPDASARFVAVDAVPVRPPTKPPVEVIIPEVFILAVVENPRAVVAVVAVPVRLPTKVVAVIIPEVFILAVVENPRAVVAVDAVPVRLPTKVVAVIIPVVLILAVVENPRAVVAVVAVPVIVEDTFKLPTTSRVAVGCVVPIPILPLEYTKSDAPSKSPLLALNGIEFTFPGPTKSVTVILTVAIPVCSVAATPTKSTVTPVPTKLNLLKLFAAPT